MQLIILFGLVSTKSLNAPTGETENVSFRFAYAIGNASWKNGLDDDAGATPADDAESKTAAIIDEIYHFNLSPFRIQLRTKRS